MGGKTQPGWGQRVGELATRQHGVVSRPQLRECGVSDDRIDGWAIDGWLHRLHRGVYAVGHTRLTARGRWMAAVLAYGPGALLTGRDALALHDVRPAPPGAIDVMVTVCGRRSRPGIRVHRSRHLHPDDATEIDAIPVTTIGRTLLEYAVRTSRGWLQVAVNEAQRRDLLDRRALDPLLARNPHHPGATKLRDALARLAGEPPSTSSELENTFWAVIVDHDIPWPQTNVLLHGELVDFYWPKARLVVEVDGYEFHKTRAQFEEDRRRDAKLQLVGERVLRFTDPQLKRRPGEAAVIVKGLLRRANLL
jgi:very-short-patch-repair endonuclease